MPPCPVRQQPASKRNGRWYLTYPLSSRQVLELLTERGIDVSHRTVLDWVPAFGPQLAAEVRRRRRPVGTRWFVDEVFLFRKGDKRYLYRAIERSGVIPDEVVTDHHRPYVKALATTCPGARHIRTGLHRARGEPTQAVERSHVRTRDRLRNSRGLKRTATGQRFLEGYEAVRHLRRGGRPGAGSLVRGRARHARVRAVVTAIHALGYGLRRQP